MSKFPGTASEPLQHVQFRRLHNQATTSLQILPLCIQDYGQWDDFCQSSDQAWFWHTSHWLEYTLNYRPELAPRSVSFFCMFEGRLVAICPLILETHCDADGNIPQFSYGGDAAAAPVFANGLSPRQSKTIAAAVLNQVDQLAREHSVKRVCFRSSPMAPATWNSHPEINSLLRFGYLDVSLATQVIDLSADEDVLLRDMRKGHRAAVKQAEKMLTCEVLDSSTITEQRFEQYRLLHQKAAGRVTRPLSTFRMMYNWIAQNHVILASASREGKPAGFALTILYKNGAYYGSGCEDPELNHLPIGHLLQWRTMQWLKQHGIRRYEIGIQNFGSVPHAMVSEKEMNISLFKRGFGGETVPFWRGEKFYHQEYCRSVLVERANRYADAGFGAKGNNQGEAEGRE
jgi:hypothetical protein